MGEAGGRQRRRRWLLACVLVAGVAAFLRLETIDQRNIWYDETYTYNFCKQARSLTDVWRAAAVDTWEHPPLHYVVTYLALGIEDSRRLFRLPSALAGVICVLLTMSLGRALFDARVGVVAGVLMALSVYHVNYSMDGRPYMMLLALVCGQFLSLVRFLRHGRPLPLLAFVACGVAALYTHHLATSIQAALGLLAGGHLIARLARHEPGQRRRVLRDGLWLAAAFAAIGLCYLPQLVYLLKFLGSGRLVAKHTLRLSPEFLHALFARWGAGPGPVAALIDLLFVLGLGAIVQRRDLGAGLLAWLAAPFAVFALVPFAKFFDIRFVMTALPAFQLIVALGIVSLGRLVGAGLRALPAPSRVATHGAALATLLALLVPAAASLRVYATFRTTQVRCSNFPWNRDLLVRDAGFCRKHILLNSLIPDDAPLLLRPVRRAPG